MFCINAFAFYLGYESYPNCCFIIVFAIRLNPCGFATAALVVPDILTSARAIKKGNKAKNNKIIYKHFLIRTKISV
jgi:hypothetical protein